MSQDESISVEEAIITANRISNLTFKSVQAELFSRAFTNWFGAEPRGDLQNLYESGLERIGDEISGYPVLVPGRRSSVTGEAELLNAYLGEFRINRLCPVLSDGCGNYHCTFVDDEGGAIYFFDTSKSLAIPAWISASGISRLILAAAVASISDGGWPSEPSRALEIDPFLLNNERAPPIWLALD